MLGTIISSKSLFLGGKNMVKNQTIEVYKEVI
jgi:hypothetical protein